MKSIILIGYFRELFEAFKKQENYNKVIILEKKTVRNINDLSNFFDVIIQVDNLLDETNMSKEIENILSIGDIDAIYAAHEWVVEICGYLRDKYHINGNSSYIAKATRDKFLMKTLVTKAGIKTAKVKKVTDIKSIEEFIEKNGFPIVIKPQSGSATQNTFLLHSKSEIPIILSKLNLKRDQYIVESFSKGEEYHCDSIVSNGEIIYCSVGKYLSNCINTILGKTPVASIIYPSHCSKDRIIKKIMEVNKIVIQEFGITDSVCHLEVFVDEREEVTFGEIASRIGGGPLIGKTIKYGYKMDIYDEFVSIGIHNARKADWISEKFVGFIALPTKAGKIIEISSAKDYNDIDGIKEVCILNNVGDFLEDNYNTTKRTGYIIAEAESFVALKEKLLNMYNKFKLTVQEKQISLSSIY